MWLLVFVFFVLTLLIGWMLFGYLLLTWFIGLLRSKKEPKMPESFPMISIVIPCYNEESLILEKLNNLRKSTYPRDCLDVIFVDGGSTDNTYELLMSEIKKDEPYKAVQSLRKGKIHQLNHVLPLLKGEIIVNTDVDSYLDPDTLKWLVAEFNADANVWVVGAYCHPDESAMNVEKHYWDAQNKSRFLETDAETSSIVIAQCYAFRRDLLTSFPEDVVADDIYVAFLATVRNYRTVYSRKATAIETRGPKCYREFLPHKFRKSNAFLKESLRFLYRLPEMRPFCKMMFLTRVAQQLLLPWAGIFWMLIAGVLITLFRFDIVIIGCIFLLVILLLTKNVFLITRLPSKSNKYSLFTIINGYIVANFILLATGLSYPFFCQGSSYARIERREKKR